MFYLWLEIQLTAIMIFIGTFIFFLDVDLSFVVMSICLGDYCRKCQEEEVEIPSF